MFTDQAQQDVIMVLKFPSNSPVTHVAANTQPGLANPAVITVTANRLFAVNKWHNLPGKFRNTCKYDKYTGVCSQILRGRRLYISSVCLFAHNMTILTILVNISILTIFSSNYGNDIF